MRTKWVIHYERHFSRLDSLTIVSIVWLQSFSIPAPHLSLPIELLAPPLQKRLAIIEDGVSVLLTSVSAREELVRAEMQDALDEQRLAKAEERVKRTKLERELEAEKEKAVQAARLMDQFASGAFKPDAIG